MPLLRPLLHPPLGLRSRPRILLAFLTMANNQEQEQEEDSSVETGDRTANASAVAKVGAAVEKLRDKDKFDPANAVLAVNPAALRDAEDVDKGDASAGSGNSRLLLFGEPVLIKDNIDVRGMATTAGSLALRDNVAREDAEVVARLRRAGAVPVAKTNLSEWANFRSTGSFSGWSAVGGFTHNPACEDGAEDEVRGNHRHLPCRTTLTI